MNSLKFGMVSQLPQDHTTMCQNVDPVLDDKLILGPALSTELGVLLFFFFCKGVFSYFRSGYQYSHLVKSLKNDSLKTYVKAKFIMKPNYIMTDQCTNS